MVADGRGVVDVFILRVGVWDVSTLVRSSRNDRARLVLLHDRRSLHPSFHRVNLEPRINDSVDDGVGLENGGFHASSCGGRVGGSRIHALGDTHLLQRRLFPPFETSKVTRRSLGRRPEIQDQSEEVGIENQRDSPLANSCRSGDSFALADFGGGSAVVDITVTKTNRALVN